jgi:SAM-dependent methyltransferase
VTAVDISEAAVEKGRQLAEAAGLKLDWLVSDALVLPARLGRKFSWALASGLLHMLVEDADRRQFLKALLEVMEPGGSCLLINMGDGLSEEKEDPARAFVEEERLHLKDGDTLVKKVMLPATASRTVNWGHHKAELFNAGFRADGFLDTVNNVYKKSMTVYLRKPV